MNQFGKNIISGVSVGLATLGLVTLPSLAVEDMGTPEGPEIKEPVQEDDPTEIKTVSPDGTVNTDYDYDSNAIAGNGTISQETGKISGEVYGAIEEKEPTKEETSAMQALADRVSGEDAPPSEGVVDGYEYQCIRSTEEGENKVIHTVTLSRPEGVKPSMLSVAELSAILHTTLTENEDGTISDAGGNVLQLNDRSETETLITWVVVRTDGDAGLQTGRNNGEASPEQAALSVQELLDKVDSGEIPQENVTGSEGGDILQIKEGNTTYTVEQGVRDLSGAEVMALLGGEGKGYTLNENGEIFEGDRKLSFPEIQEKLTRLSVKTTSTDTKTLAAAPVVGDQEQIEAAKVNVIRQFACNIADILLDLDEDQCIVLGDKEYVLSDFLASDMGQNEDQFKKQLVENLIREYERESESWLRETTAVNYEEMDPDILVELLVHIRADAMTTPYDPADIAGLNEHPHGMAGTYQPEENGPAYAVSYDGSRRKLFYEVNGVKVYITGDNTKSISWNLDTEACTDSALNRDVVPLYTFDDGTVVSLTRSNDRSYYFYRDEEGQELIRISAQQAAELPWILPNYAAGGVGHLDLGIAGKLSVDGAIVDCIIVPDTDAIRIVHSENAADLVRGGGSCRTSTVSSTERVDGNETAKIVQDDNTAMFEYECHVDQPKTSEFYKVTGEIAYDGVLEDGTLKDFGSMEAARAEAERCGSGAVAVKITDNTGAARYYVYQHQAPLIAYGFMTQESNTCGNKYSSSCGYDLTLGNLTLIDGTVVASGWGAAYWTLDVGVKTAETLTKYEGQLVYYQIQGITQERRIVDVDVNVTHQATLPDEQPPAVKEPGEQLPEGEEPEEQPPEEKGSDEQQAAEERVDEQPSDFEIPDEASPLSAEPVELPASDDIPDEQPPLFDIPDEQSFVLESSDEQLPVPEILNTHPLLAEVPDTGNRSIWPVMAGISAVGLAAIGLSAVSFMFKKRRGY